MADRAAGTGRGRPAFRPQSKPETHRHDTAPQSYARTKRTDPPARSHSEDADEAPDPEALPRETGDDRDPVKRLTGRGKASKGPYKQQGGAGHGEN